MHPTKTAPRSTRANLLLLAVGGALLFAALPADATADKVTFCHATGSESNPYVEVEAAAAGVFNGHLGAGHQGGEDIIPPFTYQQNVYSQNYDAEGQAILAAHCAVPSETTTTTGSQTQTTTGVEVPVFSSVTSLVLAVGGALGGVLLMLRRRL
jgi:ABC-type sugar transport system substrate-binding protein